MKLAFVPIDNRPVCYTLPKLLAKIDESIEFYIPDRKYLGGLKQEADIDHLFEWLITLPKLDAIILSLDTLAYGGLIPSRRCPETFEQIKERIETLKEILEGKDAKIYAFSSIMRIYLQWQKEGLFETLIFSKDDCAEYGFNVQEAQVLEKMGAYTKTGADEIPLSLLSRAIQGEMKICPKFLEPESKNLISNYEDVSIEKSVLGQIELAGCKITDEENSDIILYINNFKNNQGEIVMKVGTESFSKTFTTPNKPYMIADVRFANGADNNFVKELFKNKINDENFYGFSAWNTSANSLGSLICGAKIKFFAKKYNEKAFKKLQITRFLDDWAYQANVRQQLEKPNIEKTTELMKDFEKTLEKVLNTNIAVNYKFPWERLFEVEVDFN